MPIFYNENDVNTTNNTKSPLACYLPIYSYYILIQGTLCTIVALSLTSVVCINLTINLHSEVLQNTGTSIITILLRKAMRLLTLYVEYTIAKYSD
jgi:hypothetical protein